MQLLVIVEGELKLVGKTEGFLYYYDIFVRNAFGNYRDILREVSYNKYMAETLSFLGSKSSAFMLEFYGVKAFAGKLSKAYCITKELSLNYVCENTNKDTLKCNDPNR